MSVTTTTAATDLVTQTRASDRVLTRACRTATDAYHTNPSDGVRVAGRKSVREALSAQLAVIVPLVEALPNCHSGHGADHPFDDTSLACAVGEYSEHLMKLILLTLDSPDQMCLADYVKAVKDGMADLLRDCRTIGRVATSRTPRLRLVPDQEGTRS